MTPSMLRSIAATFPLAAAALACGTVAADAPVGAAQGATKESATAPPLGQMVVGPSQAAGNDLLWNSGFEEGTLAPWTTSFDFPAKGNAKVADGEVCLQVDAGGTNPYDLAIRQRPVGLASGHAYQIRFKVHSSAPTKVRPRLRQVAEPRTEYWAAVVDVSSQAQTFTGTFNSTIADAGADFALQLGGPLAGKPPFTICFDDIEINDPKFEIPVARTQVLPRVRVNQVGYLPDFAKAAVVKSTSKEPLAWTLVDGANANVTSGKTVPYGEDKAAGELDHFLDFTSVKAPGKGYRLRIDKDESAPFEIGRDIYKKLKYDALAFFYQQRSGIEIAMPYAGGKQWVRPAGHLSDKSVPCAPEAKCSYSLDVSGGWYDAGDHGKYVVNAGISVWTLQNEYERARYLGKNLDDFADGTMNIPEHKNGFPDLLDEARFEIDWMLRMQVPAGQPLAGMAHHKIHGESWSPIPTRPDQDPVKRYLRPVSTAATLNLSASAAQAARLWKTLDPAFSKRCLEAAETAWRAAKQNPSVVAEGEVKGGGSYGDSNFDDEFYWAAAELYITTGKAEYQKEIEGSPQHKTITLNAGGGTASMSWDQVAALGKISLAVVPNGLGKAAIDDQRKQIVGAADAFLGFAHRRVYRVPLQSESNYPWGSNVFVLNDTVVMGLAYDFTHEVKYVNGIIAAMDYILGENPNVQSYVSGYGSRPLQNPHHRFWAHSKDPSLPSVPPGVVSGGPNSGIDDPYAKQVGLAGCAPQRCYVDNIESWSTNEIAINWNAPLAWSAAFLDDVEHHR
jgi:endoglucanase